MGAGGFPAQRGSNVEHVSIWWRHVLHENTTNPTQENEADNSVKQTRSHLISASKF